MSSEANLSHYLELRVPKRASSARTSSSDRQLCNDGLLRPWPDAAEFLGGISRTEIYTLLASGAIPYVRLRDSGSRKIPKRALLEYLNARVIERAL